MNTCSPYERLKGLRLSAIESVPAGAHGIYGFWYRRRCIYIGQAARQTLSERLKQHYQSSTSPSGASNPRLAYWLAAMGSDLSFAYCICEDSSEIDALERHHIKRFQPLANRRLLGH